jgi:hypothetical protein
MNATKPRHFIFLDVIILIIFGEESNYRAPPTSSYSHPSTTPSSQISSVYILPLM